MTEGKCNGDCEGFQPSVWGPGLWLALHMITFNYPENPNKADQKNYKRFFKYLAEVLPCAQCRIHFKKSFTDANNNKENSPFANRESLARWLYELHENVSKPGTRHPPSSVNGSSSTNNHMAGTRSVQINSFEEAKQFYLKFKTNPSSHIKSHATIMITNKKLR